MEKPDPRLAEKDIRLRSVASAQSGRNDLLPRLRWFNMPQLSTGDKAPAIVLPAIDGSTLDMSNLREKSHFTFFRFSTCPLCNMRIRKIKQRWNEFSSDTVMVGVFDADIDDLRKRMRKHDAPFTIVADESYGAFESNGVSKSFGKFMWGAAKSPLTLLLATMRGYVPLTMSIANSPPYRLTSSSTKVAMLWRHYCKDTADHMSLDKMIAFSNGTP